MLLLGQDDLFHFLALFAVERADLLFHPPDFLDDGGLVFLAGEEEKVDLLPPFALLAHLGKRTDKRLAHHVLRRLRIGDHVREAGRLAPFEVGDRVVQFAGRLVDLHDQRGLLAKPFGDPRDAFRRPVAPVGQPLQLARLTLRFAATLAFGLGLRFAVCLQQRRYQRPALKRLNLTVQTLKLSAISYDLCARTDEVAS